ncbi:MAG: alpha-glucan family phosphorylase, partial [Bacteroidetes bacterium]
MQNNILFEVSWEICNKVGGINTVIASKAPILAKQFGENHIFIGPDILDEAENSDFIEDNNLFPEWRNYALSQGLNVRVGRWNINDKPIAILIDFTSFFSQKNDIFSNFWERYKLDSLNGQWDYIEPALFGYAAGKTIQSFYQFVFSESQSAVAHFHEWMTGAGVLYLKENAPYIATVFTTHATFMGRVLAGNNMPLYSKMHDYKPHIIAKQFNITSKFSLEKVAAEQADVFTTVSNNTAKECAAFLNKSPEYITPNGFDDSLVPQGREYNIKRNSARKLLTKVSEAVLSYKLKNPFFVINSGRYEFRNKGIDVFIDSLNKLNDQDKNSDRDIVALITVPANHNGVNAEVLQRLNSGVKGEHPCFTTH